MHESQQCYGELAELTVDDIWQSADAGDQELRRLAHRSRRDTMELGGEENDGLSQQLVLHSLRNNEPLQVVMHQQRETTLILNMLQMTFFGAEEKTELQ